METPPKQLPGQGHHFSIAHQVFLGLTTPERTCAPEGPFVHYRQPQARAVQDTRNLEGRRSGPDHHYIIVLLFHGNAFPIFTHSGTG
jgi:hypothetical protein